jgi:hypothetical protein
MAVTLAQAKLNTQDDLDRTVYDEFRKSSALMDALIYHDAVNPMGGGSTLTYGYHRLITQATAAFRAINAEYTPQEVTKARYTVDLKVLGGSFQIDRVLANIARGAEVSLQMSQKIKATSTKFSDEVINGDTAVDANGFDGLNKALAGSDTELGLAGPTDWSNIDSSGFQNALDAVDLLMSVLDGQPTVLLGNQYMMAKLAAIARRANVYVDRPTAGLLGAQGTPLTRRAFGMDGPLLIDVGTKAGSNDMIIPMRDPDNTVYSVSLSGVPTGGTFTLHVTVDGGNSEETATIAYNANAAAVDTAITNLADVPAAGVSTSGGALPTAVIVTFDGDLAGHDVVITAGDNNLTGGTNPAIVVTETGGTGGYSDLYAVRIGMDGFHGVSATGGQLVQTWMPDFERAGAVKTGEVEMGPVAVALKQTRAAAVLRNVKLR